MKRGMSIKVITENRKARHDYQILDSFEAGMVLMGSEVKALRNNQCQLKDSYVDIQKGELYLLKAHISPYAASSYNNHEPERKRKLLMNRNEIDKLDRQIREKGMSLVPLKLYFKKGIVKVSIGLGKGKKAQDKRESIKTRDANREISQKLKRNR